MRKLILGVLLWIAVGGLYAAEKPLVKVGVLLPLSGELYSYGEPVRNGFMMRLAEVEKADTNYRYEFIFEDTQGSVKGGSLAAEIPLTNFESYDGVLDLDLIQGRWYVTLAQASGEFAQRYQETYGKGIGYGAGFAYDAAGLVVNAFEENSQGEEKPSAEAVAGYFRGLDGYGGVVGELSSDAKGSIDTEAVLMRVQDGKAVPLTLEDL